VKPGSVEELCLAIDELSSNYNMRLSYGNNARSRVHDYFSDVKILSELNKLYLRYF